MTGKRKAIAKNKAQDTATSKVRKNLILESVFAFVALIIAVVDSLRALRT